MALLEVNWNPDKRQLKQFAYLWLGFFALVGLYLLVRDSRSAATIFFIIAAFGIVGSIRPEFLRPIYVLWMAAAMPIGWCISHLLLLTVYYLAITPLGLLMLLCKYDPMNRQFNRAARTYWEPHDPGENAARYFKQY
jgi:hypothetical protein